jgi:hypothetical protein
MMIGRTKQEQRELELILLGGEDAAPQAVAEANAAAMAALGTIGQIRPARQRRKK